MLLDIIGQWQSPSPPLALLFDRVTIFFLL